MSPRGSAGGSAAATPGPGHDRGGRGSPGPGSAGSARARCAGSSGLPPAPARRRTGQPHRRHPPRGHRRRPDPPRARRPRARAAARVAVENPGTYAAVLGERAAVVDTSVARRAGHRVDLPAGPRLARRHPWRRSTIPARLALRRPAPPPCRRPPAQPEVMERIEALKERLLSHPQVPETAVGLWRSLRQALTTAMDDPDSYFYVRGDELLAHLGRHLVEDGPLAVAARGQPRRGASRSSSTPTATSSPRSSRSPSTAGTARRPRTGSSSMSGGTCSSSGSTARSSARWPGCSSTRSPSSCR